MPRWLGAAKVQGMYAEKECWRGEYPERGRATQCIAAARGAVESNVIVYARRDQRPGPACHHVGVGTTGPAGRCATTCQTVASEQPRLRYRGDRSATISLTLSSLQVRPTSGRAKTTSVIDTINLRADNRGLQVLVLVNPNNPILHSHAQPDCNCRCNPDSRLNVRTRFFPPNLLMAGPVERAPV